MSNIDIRLPLSFSVTRKTGSNTPGLIPSVGETVSLLDWTNGRLADGRLKVTVSSIEDLIGGSYVSEAAATTAGLSAGDIYYNTTIGKLVTVQS